MKRRLEILLGEKPDASLDESMKEQVEKEAEKLERKDRISKAGGQLLGAAFSFIGEMFPETEESDRTIQLTEAFKGKLTECVDEGANAELKMTVTLPGKDVLDNLAKFLARMVGAAS